MNENSCVVKVDQLGPNGGDLIAIVDPAAKTVSLVEIAPKRENGKRILVWEVQDYTKTGA